MTPLKAFHFIDLQQGRTGLTIAWRPASGTDVRLIEPAVLACIAQQVAEISDAEHPSGTVRDVAFAGAETGSTSATGGARLRREQLALGRSLFDLFDGPNRELSLRLEAARRQCEILHLVVCLRAVDRTTLLQHPALGWPFQLLASDEGPLALMPDVTIAVQLGAVEVAIPKRIPGGQLRMLFMAHWPRGLDYHGEEKRLLDKLAPFVEKQQLVLDVTEEGSLDELRLRLMRCTYDVVHLVGHGAITPEAPRLAMEDSEGNLDVASARRLLEVLRAGRTMPRLLVLSSCNSATPCHDGSSLMVELVAGGVPCVIGWRHWVVDPVAIDAAEELYRRLCSGDLVTEAVAQTRRELHYKDRCQGMVQGWAQLEMLATKVPGFAIDPDETPASDGPRGGSPDRPPGIPAEGFAGRRRELQILGRVLRRGRWAAQGEIERSVAGALVVGMKEHGISSVVGRAVHLHLQEGRDVSVVDLKGPVEECQLIETFRMEAVRLGDEAAEGTLADGNRRVLQRIERLLCHHWRKRRLIIVLDAFEANLEIPVVGEAHLAPLAVGLLEVLLPACLCGQPKLLIASAVRFELPARLTGSLVKLPLDALDEVGLDRKLVGKP